MSEKLFIFWHYLSRLATVLCLCANCTLVLATPSANEPISPLPKRPYAHPHIVQLGKILFNDVRLSRDNSISCAACHNLAKGGDDGQKTSTGIDGKRGTRNAPTVINSSLNMAQFWDGRVNSLSHQVMGPITNPNEMGSEWDSLLEKLRKDLELSAQFERVYADGITRENVIDALVTFERQLISNNTPFDKYLQGIPNSISAFAEQGYKTFKQIGCAACHQGKNVGGNMYQNFGVVIPYPKPDSDDNKEDYGRYEATGKESDRYKFRVPSLRNVTETAPYFHDGSEATLEGAVRKMVHHQIGRPIDDESVRAILAFLKTLRGEVSGDLL
ncbi:MAG: c-type cytochrome [Pseudomonadales bacterium]|nr:MAG: c-type cytochrome [Pseudomonadales bacterium]